MRLPGWYLDAAGPPGQSRRVDLAYARTDMRSQGRTERRALLALDGPRTCRAAMCSSPEAPTGPTCT